MTRVLFATRAWESAPLEGGMLLLKDLARHFAASESVEPYFFSTTSGVDNGVKLLRAFRRAGWGRSQRLQFFLALLRHLRRVDIVHFAHTPTRSNSRLIRFLKCLHPNVHFVQTITAANKTRFSADTMIWGDDVTAIGPVLHQYLRNEHNVQAEIVPPVPSPDRLVADRPIPNDTRDQISTRPIVVFPIDVDRLDTSEFKVAELHAELRRTHPDVVFMLLDRFGGSERGHMQFEGISPDNLILLPAIDYMMAVLHRADVIAYPISNADGKFNPPMVLLEALGVGCPVVCSDSIDIQESDSVVSTASFEAVEWARTISSFLDRTLEPKQETNLDFAAVCGSYESLYTRRSCSETSGPSSLKSVAELETALQIVAEQQQFPIFIRAGRAQQFDITGAKDVDIWLKSGNVAKLDALLRSFGAISLITRQGKAWASQRIYLLPLQNGFVQLDVGIDTMAAGPLIYRQLVDFDGQCGLVELPSDVEVFSRGAKRLLRGGDLDDPAIAELQSLYATMDDAGRSRLAAFLKQPVNKLDTLFTPGNSTRKIRVTFYRSIVIALLSTAKYPLELFRVLRSKVTLPGWPKPFGRRVRGQVIAIVGTDGSGKSTTQNLLKSALAQDGYRTQYVYMGRSRGNVLVSDSFKSSAGRASDKSRNSRLLLKYFASWFYVLDYSLRFARIWYRSRIKGYSVLCDRYFYDIETMECYSGFAYAVLRLVALKPDILVGLDCSVDVLMQRKAERSREEYTRQRDFYRRLTENAKAKYWRETLRTDEIDSDQIADRISALVHRSAHRRYDY